MDYSDQHQQTLAASCLRVVTRYVSGGTQHAEHVVTALVALAGALPGIVLIFQLRRLIRWLRAGR